MKILKYKTITKIRNLITSRVNGPLNKIFSLFLSKMMYLKINTVDKITMRMGSKIQSKISVREQSKRLMMSNKQN